MYVGLILHAETHKRGLVEKKPVQSGLSILYDRVLHLSAEMGNCVCQMFHTEEVVCPPTLHGGVFTAAAMDNIDHNPSSTTAKDSFHSIGISLIQDTTMANEGVVRGIVITRSSSVKTVKHLPQYYTEVPPVTFAEKGSTVLVVIDGEQVICIPQQ